MRQVNQFALMFGLSLTMTACLGGGSGGGSSTSKSPVDSTPSPAPSANLLEAMSQAGCTFANVGGGVEVSCNGTTGFIANGTHGSQGIQGAQGLKGDKGGKGDTGNTGTSGTNGASCSIVGSNLVCPDGTSIAVGGGAAEKEFRLNGYSHLIKEDDISDASGSCTIFHNTMNNSKVAYCGYPVNHGGGGIVLNGSVFEAKMYQQKIDYTTWDCTGQAYARGSSNTSPIHAALRYNLVLRESLSGEVFKVTGLAAVNNIPGRSYKDASGNCQMYGTPIYANAIEVTKIASAPAGTSLQVSYPFILNYE